MAHQSLKAEKHRNTYISNKFVQIKLLENIYFLYQIIRTAATKSTKEHQTPVAYRFLEQTKSRVVILPLKTFFYYRNEKGLVLICFSCLPNKRNQIFAL